MSMLFKERQTNINARKVGFVQRFVMMIVDHFRQAFASLGELYRHPFATFMTVAVLGVSLTLPGSLYIIVKNTEAVTDDWQQAAEISLFLQQNLPEAEAQQLKTRLSLWPEIADISYISAEQALAEYIELSGLGDAITYLDENPLPAVLTIIPSAKHTTPRAAEDLLLKLKQEKEVAKGILDIEWLKRLNASLDLAKDIVLMLALLLLFAVVLIIGNTIRLNILNKRDEIIVMKLVGATDAFIHRPFLYTGFWYGLLGGLLAWFSIFVVMLWIDMNVSELFATYRINIDIAGLDFFALLLMMCVAVGLGLLGSYLSVNRHVSDIEPE